MRKFGYLTVGRVLQVTVVEERKYYSQCCRRSTSRQVCRIRRSVGRLHAFDEHVESWDVQIGVSCSVQELDVEVPASIGQGGRHVLRENQSRLSICFELFFQRIQDFFAVYPKFDFNGVAKLFSAICDFNHGVWAVAIWIVFQLNGNGAGTQRTWTSQFRDCLFKFAD